MPLTALLSDTICSDSSSSLYSTLRSLLLSEGASVDGDTQMRDESKEKQNGGSNGDAKSASQLVTAICSSLDQAMAKLVAAH